MEDDMTTTEASRALDDIEPLLVRPRIARRLLGNCGPERLWALINSGEIKSYKDGNARRISVASIKLYVARQLAQAKDEPHTPRAQATGSTRAAP
jgi:hypothetical protein